MLEHDKAKINKSVYFQKILIALRGLGLSNGCKVLCYSQDRRNVQHGILYVFPDKFPVVKISARSNEIFGKRKDQGLVRWDHNWVKDPGGHPFVITHYPSKESLSA